MSIVETDIDGVFYDRTKTKNRIINKDLVKEFVGFEMNEKLVLFAKENKLSFKDKNDLLKIFTCFKEQA